MSKTPWSRRFGYLSRNIVFLAGIVVVLLIYNNQHNETERRQEENILLIAKTEKDGMSSSYNFI